MAMFDPTEQLRRLKMAAQREYRYPNQGHAQAAFSYQSFDATTAMPETDMVIYDANTGTFRTSQQSNKIRELEKQLEEKKKEEESSLQNIIAYYYNR